ncbi:MAG: MspA family porin [Nocardia sp.]|nr:MspA family porin [Nocardia sp.]
MITRIGGWIGAVGLSAAALLSGTTTAQADTTVPLPDGNQAMTAANGVQVDMSRTGERAVVAPSLAANGLSRTVTLSGTVFAKVHSADSGTLTTGYMVGCQVDLSGGLSLGGDMYVQPGQAYPEVTPGINLVPGAVAVVKFDTKNLDPKAGAVGIGYGDRGIQVSGCAGYAQARAFSTLTVVNKQGTAEVTMYGRPFSIG